MQKSACTQKVGFHPGTATIHAWNNQGHEQFEHLSARHDRWPPRDAREIQMRNSVIVVATLVLGSAMAPGQGRSEPGSMLEVDSLSLEQMTKIGTIITKEQSARLSHITFPVSIGAVVPEQIPLQPLPPSVNELAPQFRGHSYIIVEEVIAIIDPKTRKITAALPRWREQ
jgi:hypothetical protein